MSKKRVSAGSHSPFDALKRHGWQDEQKGVSAGQPTLQPIRPPPVILTTAYRLHALLHPPRLELVAAAAAATGTGTTSARLAVCCVAIRHEELDREKKRWEVGGGKSVQKSIPEIK